MKKGKRIDSFIMIYNQAVVDFNYITGDDKSKEWEWFKHGMSYAYNVMWNAYMGNKESKELIDQLKKEKG